MPSNNKIKGLEFFEVIHISHQLELKKKGVVAVLVKNFKLCCA